VQFYQNGASSDHEIYTVSSLKVSGSVVLFQQQQQQS